MKSELIICYFKLLLALLLWAGVVFVVRKLLTYTNIYLIADIRYAVSAIILLLWYKIKKGYFLPKLNIKQWVGVLLVGFFGIIFYNLLFFSALKLISGSVYAMIFALCPSITTIIAIFLFKINFNRYTIIGILFSLIATLMLISAISPHCHQYLCVDFLNDGIGWGEILAFLATIAFALFTICNSYAHRLGVLPLDINVYATVFGLVGLIIVSTFYIHDFKEVVAIIVMPKEFWFCVFYMTFLATVLAYVWYSQAISKIGVAVTSVLQNTMPLQTVIIGCFIVGDIMPFRAFIAGGLILIGVYITHFSLRKKI